MDPYAASREYLRLCKRALWAKGRQDSKRSRAYDGELRAHIRAMIDAGLGDVAKACCDLGEVLAQRPVG